MTRPGLARPLPRTLAAMLHTPDFVVLFIDDLFYLARHINR